MATGCFIGGRRQVILDVSKDAENVSNNIPGVKKNVQFPAVVENPAVARDPGG